jgi:hypothetical protein
LDPPVIAPPYRNDRHSKLQTYVLFVEIGGRCGPARATRIPSIPVAIRDDGKSAGSSDGSAVASTPLSWGTAESADLGRRFAALLIDWILCLLAAGLIADPRAAPSVPVLILIGVYGFFVGLFAQTPGMYLTKIRCVSYADGGRIGVIRGLLRGVLLCLAIPPLIMDERRRGLHDRLVGSIVVPVAAPPAG